ncbi:MAG: hypothetical protein JWM10_957, partial [Myxococcaceae bacterium]|nr:hypothetical protein [Myxococcaceae bacterium]
WSEFFAGEAAPVAEPVAAAPVRSTVAFASTGVATQLAPPPVFAAVAPTIERPADRRGALLAGLLGCVALLGIGAWAVRNATASGSPTAAQLTEPAAPTTVETRYDAGAATAANTEESEEEEEEPTRAAANRGPAFRGGRPAHGHGHGHGHGHRGHGWR